MHLGKRGVDIRLRSDHIVVDVLHTYCSSCEKGNHLDAVASKDPGALLLCQSVSKHGGYLLVMLIMPEEFRRFIDIGG